VPESGGNVVEPEVVLELKARKSITSSGSAGVPRSPFSRPSPPVQVTMFLRDRRTRLDLEVLGVSLSSGQG
jgi:hypothetical protein